MISREYAEQHFPEFVKKVDEELRLAQEYRADECDGCGKSGVTLWKTDDNLLCVDCRLRMNARGCKRCGCPKNQVTPGCKTCYSRHRERELKRVAKSAAM